MSFETSASNLDVVDKYGIKNVNVDPACIYKGDISHINKQQHKCNSLPPPLAAAVLGLCNTGAPLSNSDKFYDAWTDIDAQELYLNSKPTCYLILSKPGVGAFILGEALSKKLNCIHLSPKNLIQDEVKQNSPTGNCVEFNMTHSKICDFKTILALLKTKLKSPAVQHRGYILSGLPLVTSCKSTYCLTNTLISEEALIIVNELLFDVICNLKKNKPKVLKEDATSQKTSVSSNMLAEEEEHEEIEEEHNPDEAGEEEEPPVELPKFILDSCSNLILNRKSGFITKKSIFFQQIQEIFDLYLKPDIIIHMTSPDTDVVTLRNHKYIDYKNNHHTFEPFVTELSSDLRWPSLYGINDYQNPHDLHIFNPKYNCKPPINFTARSTDQLCNFKNNILPYLTMQIKDFDPNLIIKVDGRNTVYQMMHQITERLVLMRIHAVLIPEPLYMEDAPEDLDEFWSGVQEIKAVHSDQAVTFKRTASPWFNRCPVELKNGRSVRGNPKFAVMFFKHVYLLSTLKAMIMFCRNPRPFLKLQYLEPSCRMIVTGTNLSGKTMVSECLSWLFDAPIICYQSFYKREKQLKYDSYSKTILSEIIATIEDARFMEWQSAEINRITNLNSWCNIQLELLKHYVELYSRQIFNENKKNRESQLLSDEFIEEEIDDEEILLGKEIASLKKQLTYFHFLENIEECEEAILNKNLLTEYAPLQLRTDMEKPKMPMLGDKDVTEAISAYIVTNELEKELEPTIEGLMNEMIKLINGIDKKTQKYSNSEQLFGKYIIDGFPTDPEFWEYISKAKLKPDYTIALIENREVDKGIFQYYTDAEKCLKNYQERFLLANDPFIKTKLLTKKPSEFIVLNMQIILQDTLNSAISLANKKEDDVPTAENTNTQSSQLQLLTESIEKFRENWDNVKLKLEEEFKSCIEVELENKSDVHVLEEVLLKIRKSYFLIVQVNEDGELDEFDDEQEEPRKDPVSYNSSQFLCDTNVYCPIAYYDYGILWEGKPEFSVIYNNKFHYFCKEEFIELFQKDVTAYQSYSKPYKKLPSLKICVIGCIGSGKTAISKFIAKELGLMHIDFAQICNEFLLPRHFKKVGRHYENAFKDVPIEEEGVADFQVDEENEHLMSDMLANETEMRRMLHGYFERGSPIISMLMQKIIKHLWFEKPFATCGFVLDGFPRIPSDVDDMIASFCIPDLVLELQSSSERSVNRLAPIMFQTWKTQLKEAKELAKIKLDNEIKEWMQFITKLVVSKLLCNDILDNVFASNFETLGGFSTESVIIDAHPSGSVKVDPKLFQIYNDMIEEYPEPKSTNEWEKPDDAHERIDSRIESIYESDDENIQTLKDILLEQRIKSVTVDAAKPFNKVIRTVMLKLEKLRHRSESFFEQTFVVASDIAETLLNEGFCFLSKFDRMCPVYIHENPHTTLNLYKIHKRNGNIYTVVHRSYIYFIIGKDSVIKFRRNPLMFISCGAIKSYISYPLKIGVIGGPKSGKSSLSAKLAKRNGLICLSRGKALRQILEYMSWTELGSQILSLLREGKCIETDLIMKAIQTIAIDDRTITNGFVLDGFPCLPSEAMELVRDGLYPNIVFDISANKDVILNYSNEIHLNILKLKPPYPYSFVEYRFAEWYKTSYKIRDWITGDYQNLYKLNGNDSKWQCLQDANDIIKTVISKMHYYLNNVQSNIVPAGVMCISNHIFNQQMSPFKNLCPLCLRTNILKHNGYPVDRKGIVQFRNRYYWICPDHIDLALRNPHLILTAQKVVIPEIPVVVKTVSGSQVYENGVCIVTYAENLPAQKIHRGNNKFAVNFQGKLYLFCGEKCLNMFLAKPHLYCGITVFSGMSYFPPLSLKSLPNLGYLEQTIGNIITEACCSVNAVRPKYPGLSFQISALIYIALYLKTHNPRINDETVRIYSRALKIFETRSQLLIDVGLRLRSMENPFSNYPRCRHVLGIRTSVMSLEQTSEKQRSTNTFSSSSSSHHKSIEYSGSARRVPVPDERFDYLCEFHKPVSKVPAFLNVVDIAGLVRGAAEGQGLGNAFLSHIKACDAIFNLCRAFDDEDVIHVDGEVNPVRDLETIGEELRLKDEEQLMQHIDKLDRVVNRGNDKKLKPEYDALMKIKTVLVEEKKHIRFGDWSAADIEVLNKYLFLTSKPALYLVNLSEKDYIRKKNKWLPKLKEWIDKNDPGAPLIPFSGVFETKLLDMEPAERQAFLKENNLSSALDKIIVQGYKALQLEYFFTAGPDEVKAWTIQKGTKAPQAAGRIHTDFEKGFIMAEVMHYKDFKEEGTEAACKSAGKYRQQGRNYVVEDGDIIFFKFNAGAGLKDAKKK